MSENTTVTKTSSQEKEKKDSFCAKRTGTEIFLTLAIIGVVSYFIYYRYNVPDIEVVKCEEPEYMESILEINNFIDPSVDPCQDFHQFACGNFFKTAYTRQVSTPLLQEIEEEHYELTSYIVEPILKGDSKQVKLQKKFYQKCLDESAIELDQDKTLLALIEQIGGWPVLKGQTWAENEFDWVAVMIKCKQLGLPFQWFLNFGLYAEEDTNILEITYPTVANNSNKDYKTLMQDVVIAMSGSKSNAHAQMAPVIFFEQNLLNVTRNCAVDINVTSVGELQTLNLKYNWVEILNNLTEEIYEFSEDSPVASGIKSYFLELDHLLIGTPKRIQANYIVWKIIEYFSPFLSSSLHTLFEKLSRAGSAPESRIDICIANTAKFFPYVKETEHIRKYAKPGIRKSVKNITNLLRNEFVNRLAKAFWIKNKTLNHYLHKFKTSDIDVGGQEELFDQTFFDNNYLHIGNLDYSSDDSNIIEMITERGKSYYESVFSAIGEPGIKKEIRDLYDFNTESTPFHYSTQNRIVIPSMFLHGSIYDFKRPKYLNYGSLGSVIGAVLTRSFLEELREEDTVKDIWTHKDYKVFENGTKCFEDDISKMFKGEPLVNTSHIVQETIPYIIGRDLAYTTYQKWVEANEKKIKLLPLSYNANQLFWIKSSLINCYKAIIQDEDDEDKEEEELDSLIYKYADVLSLRHSPHFAKDFDCPAGSPMNPKGPRKCWLFL